jgi:hypothetical protein
VDRAGQEAAAPDAPFLLPDEQPGPLEDRQVLGNGGQRHRERPRQFADRGIRSREPREDRPPRRVRQSRERRVERRRIVNHTVKY